MDFELDRKDIHQTRFVHADPPSPTDGQALLRIESFGLTSNNITYAVLGDAMNYWSFFPASDPEWASLNVWGFAHVEDSRHPDLALGTRVYGYFPCASHLLVVPASIDDRGFVDSARHRAQLPAVYQAYRNVETDPLYSADREALQILFFPLYVTSFLIDDFLADEGFFGADTVVISSASSKTAIIAAYLLAQRDGVEAVGLTSAANLEFVEGLGIYDSVVLYQDISTLALQRAVYIDIAGDSAVRSAVHAHYGASLAHSTTVGMTHWDQAGPGDRELAGPRPVFFFAPDRIKKRSADWGRATFDQNIADAWVPFVHWAAEWLQVEKVCGADAIKRVYLELLNGKINPRAGTIVEL